MHIDLYVVDVYKQGKKPLIAPTKEELLPFCNAYMKRCLSRDKDVQLRGDGDKFIVRLITPIEDIADKYAKNIVAKSDGMLEAVVMAVEYVPSMHLQAILN